ncbi:Fe(3+) ABC transporter substrate-binding protein [Bacillus carboniphilus]|uniref:Fe(3+) ABC transporter substrate-binding protein n=1 Tax=Bacillus carboniphilus TaxID=86663 RepID=A0ABP3G3V1_9BACI
MKKRMYTLGVMIIAALMILAACGNSNNEKSDGKTSSNTEDKGVVNLYTSRHYDTDRELYDKFTEQTGIKVNVIEGNGDELMERLDREGPASEADVFITSDAGNLARLKEKGLTQSVESDILFSNIPEKLRDTENHWFGLTKRARVIAYAKDRVDPSELSTYEALTEDQWNGRLLIRSSENIYNQSLLGSFIEINGEEAAKEWAAGIVKNMARDPQGGDTDQMKAIAAGEADVAVVNSYYIGRLINSENPEDTKVGEQIGVFFPNQETTGTHINISGAAVTKHSKNIENAITFIEFLSSEDAQGIFAEGNNEYPVNPSVEPSETLKSWGDFIEQDIDLTVLGKNNSRAIQIFNEVGWK